jgi:hypothetical protein
MELQQDYLSFVIIFRPVFYIFTHVNAANTPTGANIILTKTKQSVPTIAGKIPFGHSIFGIALMNSQLITQYP